MTPGFEMFAFEDKILSNPWTYDNPSKVGWFFNQLRSPFQNPILLLFLLLPALLTLSHYIYKDYQFFLSLGAGGTPSTVRGWLWITFLRLFAHRDPYSPSTLRSHPAQPKGYFQTTQGTLPSRPGPRPTVAGIAPQRQLTQQGTQEIFSLLSAAILGVATANAETLTVDTSCFEKHSTGLFSRDPIQHSCDGEICHVHPSDGSLHLTLHPDDIRVLLLTGWGQRHPLARGEWLKRLTRIPPGFVMVYAPRDKGEMEVVMTIVRAAVWWVDGRSV
ncbi:MAG: hypothetical protein M1816_003744 [Peltula sp. TS41687]|nr:MAG: hypothetical protein M1816_003744 [Peltula sp. TS41687]